MLELRPCDYLTAARFVDANHRHNRPPCGHKFSIACYSVGGGIETLVGVAIVGRPIARRLDDGMTLEITRNCTDGTRNACSMLYGACCRAAAALGYKKIITYTLMTESGASLRASGFSEVAITLGHSWNSASRPRTLVQESLFGETIKYVISDKRRWEKELR